VASAVSPFCFWVAFFDLSPIYEQVKNRDFCVVAGSVEAVGNGFYFPQLPRTGFAYANSCGVL